MLKINFTPNVTGWILENIDHESVAIETCVCLEKIYFRPAMLVYKRINSVDFCIWWRPGPGIPIQRLSTWTWCLVFQSFWDIPISGTQKQSNYLKQNTKSSIIAWSYFSLGFMEHEAFAQAVQLLALPSQCLIVQTFFFRDAEGCEDPDDRWIK